MRVLTYNIHGWKGIDGRIDVSRLARVIASSQADVVALNEVFHPLVPQGARRPALDLLAEALGMTVAFGVALTPSDAFAPLALYGNALLTRFPLLAHAGHHLTPIDGHEQRVNSALPNDASGANASLGVSATPNAAVIPRASANRSSAGRLAPCGTRG